MQNKKLGGDAFNLLMKFDNVFCFYLAFGCKKCRCTIQVLYQASNDLTECPMVHIVAIPIQNQGLEFMHIILGLILCQFCFSGLSSEILERKKKSHF